MKDFYLLLLISMCTYITSCSTAKPAANTSSHSGNAKNSPKKNNNSINKISSPPSEIKSTVILKEKIPLRTINTKSVSANELVTFSETLIGTPYLWAGTTPAKGFDCSGFIYYVFNKYKITVPRISKDYTNAGKEVSTLSSKRGDIILFTGYDINSGVVGHMGIITKNDNGYLQFIHSASSTDGGVMISEMNGYFIPRFVKVIRVFPSL